jgi:shikimate kinase
VNHVFIVGFMGAGKSTVGPAVAARLERPFLDLDALVEARAGRPIAAIFAEDGESGFRAREHDALEGLADAEPSVVACGGGVVVDDRNRPLLRRLGTVVYLRVTAEEALARVGAEGAGRPLLAVADPAAAARTLLAAREVLYAAVADVTIDTTGHDADEVADAVVEALS